VPPVEPGVAAGAGAIGTCGDVDPPLAVSAYAEAEKRRATMPAIVPATLPAKLDVASTPGEVVSCAGSESGRLS
jgi:hypothetical protein